MKLGDEKLDSPKDLKHLLVMEGMIYPDQGTGITS